MVPQKESMGEKRASKRSTIEIIKKKKEINVNIGSNSTITGT